MYDLSASGLRGLAVLRRVHDTLADDHRAHLKMPFTYVRVAFSLYKRVRRCKHNVEMLCQELDAKIRRFDDVNQGSNAHRLHDEEAACSRDWLDAVLTALSDN
ncbi:hypothetical protein C8R44DRAFT_728151 [Mycena epipterygia]|nr:hypothetical protein C8R44DRAFT_728151 [Mycena epipterygia]